MIRNLIFDMGGIILPMRPKSIPIERFATLGLAPEVGEEIFSPYGQQGIFEQAETGELSAEEFLEAYRSLTGHAITFDQVQWGWLGFVEEPPRERLEWLDQLRAEGYHVALLSNTNPFIQAHIEPLIAAHFDAIYYSYRLGACKPNERAFRAMLAQGAYDPHECLFFDDALHNVEAARRLGIHALHVPDIQAWLSLLRSALTQGEG